MLYQFVLGVVTDVDSCDWMLVLGLVTLFLWWVLNLPFHGSGAGDLCIGSVIQH